MEQVLSTLPVSLAELRLGLWLLPPQKYYIPPDAMQGAMLDRLDRLLSRLESLERVLMTINDTAGNRDQTIFQVIRDGLPAVSRVLLVEWA